VPSQRDLFANFDRMRCEINNEPDLDEFPPHLLSGMQFLFADTSTTS